MCEKHQRIGGILSNDAGQWSRMQLFRCILKIFRKILGKTHYHDLWRVPGKCLKFSGLAFFQKATKWLLPFYLSLIFLSKNSVLKSCLVWWMMKYKFLFISLNKIYYFSILSLHSVEIKDTYCTKYSRKVNNKKPNKCNRIIFQVDDSECPNFLTFKICDSLSRVSL